MRESIFKLDCFRDGCLIFRKIKLRQIRVNRLIEHFEGIKNRVLRNYFFSIFARFVDFIQKIFRKSSDFFVE